MQLIKLLLFISIITALSGCSTKKTKVCSSDGFMYEVSPDTKKSLGLKMSLPSVNHGKYFSYNLKKD